MMKLGLAGLVAAFMSLGSCSERFYRPSGAEEREMILSSLNKARADKYKSFSITNTYVREVEGERYRYYEVLTKGDSHWVQGNTFSDRLEYVYAVRRGSKWYWGAEK